MPRLPDEWGQFVDDDALDVGDQLVEQCHDGFAVAPQASLCELYLQGALKVEVHARLKLLTGVENVNVERLYEFYQKTKEFVHFIQDFK